MNQGEFTHRRKSTRPTRNRPFCGGIAGSIISDTPFWPMGEEKLFFP
jgi:hypothetical protein